MVPTPALMFLSKVMTILLPTTTPVASSAGLNTVATGPASVVKL
jgi:hypothetical protein